MQFRFGSTTIAITHADRDALRAAVGDRWAKGQGFAVATINLDHLVKLGRNPAFLRAYATLDMVVADGNPIVWLSRLARRPVALVPGSDLLLPLVRDAAAAGRSLALFGASEPALAEAERRLCAAVPGLRVVLRLSPPMGFDPEGAVADSALGQIAASGAGLCIIALGAPKQEIFAARGRLLAPQTGFALFGAGLDFVAGTQRRAPRWVRAIAMEWLWRALSAPRRLIPRYAACAAILPGQALAALRQREG